MVQETQTPLTNPSMHGDSLMAPQQPRKPTTIMRAPAAIRMYTPAETSDSYILWMTSGQGSRHVRAVDSV